MSCVHFGKLFKKGLKSKSRIESPVPQTKFHGLETCFLSKPTIGVMSLVGHGTATRNSSASVSQAVKPAKMLYQLCAGCLRMHPKCACPMAHSNGKL